MIERNTFGSIENYPSLKAVYNIYDTSCKFHQRKIARFIQEMNISIAQCYKIDNYDFVLKTLNLIKNDFIDRADQFDKTDHDLTTHMKCFISAKFNETIQKITSLKKCEEHFTEKESINYKIRLLSWQIYKLSSNIK